MKKLLLLLVLAVPAFAQTPMHWNMIGAAGSIEPASMSLAEFSRMSITFAQGQFGTIHLRYPVTNVYGSGFTTVAPWGSFEAAFTPNGGNLVFHLLKVDRCTKQQTIVCSIYHTSSDTRTNCERCNFSGGLDFGQNIYYIEAQMTRSTAAGYPRIEHVSVY